MCRVGRGSGGRKRGRRNETCDGILDFCRLRGFRAGADEHECTADLGSDRSVSAERDGDANGRTRGCASGDRLYPQSPGVFVALQRPSQSDECKMIRGPENLIVDVSGCAVVMRELPWWFLTVLDDDGLLWRRDPKTGEWWAKETET